MANSATTMTSAGAERRKPAAGRNASPDGEVRLNGAADVAQAQAEADQKERAFFWTYTEEPHRTRRLAIIKAHPEVCQPPDSPLSQAWSCADANDHSLFAQVTKLCGPEPLTKYVVAFVVALQMFCGYLLKDTSFWSWKFWALAYVVGATANQNTFLAIHEISHNLAFRSPSANRLFAIFANLPIGLPYSASFRVSSCNPSARPQHKRKPVANYHGYKIALPPDSPQIAWR